MDVIAAVDSADAADAAYAAERELARKVKVQSYTPELS